jgi:hypothetical protein
MIFVLLAGTGGFLIVGELRMIAREFRRTAGGGATERAASVGSPGLGRRYRLTLLAAAGLLLVSAFGTTSASFSQQLSGGVVVDVDFPAMTPTPQPTPTPEPTANPTANPTAKPKAAPTDTPPPTDTPAPPVVTPAPTDTPAPIIACGPTTITTADSISCSWTNVWTGSQTVEWDLSVSTWGFNSYAAGSNSVTYGPDAWSNGAYPYELQLRVTRDGVPYLSTIVEVTVTA